MERASLHTFDTATRLGVLGLREELAKICGVRREFQGAFDRYGTKSGWKGRPVRTILLLNVEDCLNHEIMTNHLWFTETKGFAAVQLQQGDVVRFNARVTRYVKGYRGRRDEDFDERSPVELDYRLSFPTKLTVVSHTRCEPCIAVGLYKNKVPAIIFWPQIVNEKRGEVQQAQLTRWC